MKLSTDQVSRMTTFVPFRSWSKLIDVDEITSLVRISIRSAPTVISEYLDFHRIRNCEQNRFRQEGIFWKVSSFVLRQSAKERRNLPSGGLRLSLNWENARYFLFLFIAENFCQLIFVIIDARSIQFTIANWQIQWKAANEGKSEVCLAKMSFFSIRPLVYTPRIDQLEFEFRKGWIDWILSSQSGFFSLWPCLNNLIIKNTWKIP